MGRAMVWGDGKRLASRDCTKQGARHRPRGFCPCSHAARLCRSYHHTQAYEKACRQAHYTQESQCYGLKLKERIARKGGLFRNPRFVRYCEGYHVPWLFLSTLMNFNFNPQTYCFTSSIPDVFEMSDFQGSSVYLAIYLNRSQSPVFSTTLYAHGGKASIYDLRSIIENYMEAKQLVHATCSFRMQVDRTDYTLGEFTLIYCKLQMLRTNCDLLFSKILRTFAVTVPTTLPIEQRTRVGLLLFIRMRYSKTTFRLS